MLFLEQHDIRGYAIVIPFWSNEVGGNVLFIDELFVKPPARPEHRAAVPGIASQGAAVRFDSGITRGEPCERTRPETL